MAMCPGAGKQKPGFDHRDDKTLDKALCLPPKALPALCRHQELNHRAPKATGECNHPCLAEGEDDFGSPGCPGARPAGSQLPVLTTAAASIKTSGSSLSQCPWQLGAESSQRAGFMGVGLLASSVVAPAPPWHLFRAAQFPEIQIIIFMHYRYLTRKCLILLNGKRYRLEPAPGDSPAPGMCNKGFGGCQHT